MSPNIFVILFVVLNLLTICSAYRLDRSNEAIQGLFHKNEGDANDGERLADLYDLKQADEYNTDNYYFIPCHPTSSHVLCNKFDHLSRRDTGFLRFGRKR